VVTIIDEDDYEDEEDRGRRAVEILREARETTAREKKKTEKAKRGAEWLPGPELARRLIPAAVTP
jgi:hypothetical protein